jgi:chemotaxis protein CheZ
MPLRRKVFRIEEMLAKAAPPAQNGTSAGQQDDILRELKTLRGLFERHPADAGKPNAGAMGADEGLRQLKDETGNIHRAIARTKQEIAALHVSGFSGAEYGRVFRELDAVVGGAERAIEQILAAAEDIDEAANTLSAILKHEQDRALAQDIRDQVIRIFEACNFHDLAGQRIGKVLATLKFVEDRVARMMAIWGGIDAFKDFTAAAAGERDDGPPLINGPKLEGDSGHASQADIDALFG